MFRSILKFKLNNTILTVRHLKDHSKICSKLSENDKKKFETKEKWIETDKATKLSDNLNQLVEKSKEETVKLVHQPKLNSNENLEHNLKQCESLEKLLNLIELNLFEFKSNELRIVFNQLRQIIFLLNYRKISSLKESVQKLLESPIFNSLLRHANDLIDELDQRCLIELFDLIFTIRLDPNNEIMKNTLNRLINHLDHFQLDDFTLCLRTIDLNMNYMKSNYQIIEFKQNLLMSAKNRILEHQFNFKEVDTMINFLFRFLDPNNDPKFQVTNHLIRLLLSSEVKIEFKQSVRLLNKIQISHSLFTQKYRRTNSRTDQTNICPRNLEQLIEKCNLTILDKFNSEPTKRDNFIFYLSKIHAKTVSLQYQFKNIHDEQLFEPLTEFVLKNHQIMDINLIGCLIRNYSKIYRYDERLLKLIYKLLFSERLRNDKQFNLDNIYYLLSQYRLPFVDHQELLSKILFNFSNEFRSMRKITNKIYLLIELVLNDINDKKMLDFLCEGSSNNTGQRTIGTLEIYDYKRIALAKVYLSLFSQLKDIDFKLKIKKRIDQYHNQFLEMNRRPNISHKYIKIDSRLSINGYLSNGIYLDSFAIYDKQKNDLICLKQFRNYFDKIDQIKIEDGQEL